MWRGAVELSDAHTCEAKDVSASPDDSIHAAPLPTSPSNDQLVRARAKRLVPSIRRP
jgi:hypothetical protein